MENEVARVDACLNPANLAEGNMHEEGATCFTDAAALLPEIPKLLRGRRSIA